MSDCLRVLWGWKENPTKCDRPIMCFRVSDTPHLHNDFEIYLFQDFELALIGLVSFTGVGWQVITYIHTYLWGFRVLQNRFELMMPRPVSILLRFCVILWSTIFNKILKVSADTYLLTYTEYSVISMYLVSCLQQCKYCYS